MSHKFLHDAGMRKEVEGGDGGHGLVGEGELRSMIVSSGASCAKRTV